MSLQLNQYVFETVRDLVTMMKKMECGDNGKLIIEIKKHGDLYDWTCNFSQTCGPYEASIAMKRAYERVFSENEPRDMM